MLLSKNGPEADIIIEAFNSVASIVITDAKGRFVFVNDVFCQLIEYSREELLGKTGSIFKSGVHDEAFYQNFWEVIRAGEVWRGVFCNKTKSGKHLWVDTVVKPVYGANNQIEKYVGIHLNVTENVQNKSALKSQEEQLLSVSKFATLGEISGFIAHEIKNPLFIMSMVLDSLEVILNSDLPDIDKIKKLNERLKNVSNKISKVVASLGNFSRNEQAFNMQTHKMQEILDDSLLIIDYLVKSNGVKFSIEEGFGNDRPIKCFKTQISQVLINLIKNACEAVRNQEVREVKVLTSAVDDSLQIRVIDSGPRIADEVAASLFTPYFTTKKEGGTGIGLNLSAKILENHGGHIYLDRTSDQTCFVLTIPLG